MSTPFSKKVLAEVLNGIGRVVAEGDGETLQRLYIIIANKKSAVSTKPMKPVTRSIKTPDKKAPSSPLVKQLFDSDDDLREKLYSFESREALADFIDDKFPRKADVIALSKVARVAVNKNDDYVALVERLIDATIGYKLRSRAIRGDG
jgi:hypothetical protein